MRLLFLLHLKCTVIKFAAGEFPQGEPFCPVRFNKKGDPTESKIPWGGAGDRA